MISLWKLLPIVVRFHRNGLLPKHGPRVLIRKSSGCRCCNWAVPGALQQMTGKRSGMQNHMFVVHAVRMPSAVLTEVHCRSWRTRNHSRGLCATRDVCGHRADGKTLDCPYNGPGKQFSPAVQKKFQQMCPQLFQDHGGGSGLYCCTERQIDTMAAQVSPELSRSVWVG